MDNNEQKKEACMACSCPCEAHKEHNHPIEKKEAEHDEHGGICTHCGAKKEEDTCGWKQ